MPLKTAASEIETESNCVLFKSETAVSTFTFRCFSFAFLVLRVFFPLLGIFLGFISEGKLQLWVYIFKRKIILNKNNFNIIPQRLIYSLLYIAHMSKIHRSESERSSGDHKTVGFLTHNFSWPYGQPRDRPIRKGWWGWETFKDQSTVIYHLGGGRVEDFRGVHLIFERTKGGISRNWEPKRGITENFGKDSEGGPLNLLGKWRHGGGGGGGGGSRKS